ncbi:MAG: hypothetical protein KKC51_06520, partial [Verrucomicrobia bacterium]|nr:hypothetical protein [Verrucomicrobiota bacterium]
IRKMVLASAKVMPGDATGKRELAEQLLQTPGLSRNEWLATAKEVVRAGLWEGRTPDLDALIRYADTQYGEDSGPRAAHSLALSCMMAKHHDLARPLLQRNIAQLQAGKSMWGKSVWALARMESLLGNHAAAAGLYRQFFEAESIPVRFRLQAQLLWAQALVTAGQPDALLEARPLMTTALSNVQDPEILMNFARQLQVGPVALRDWSKELFSQGEARALQCFHEASHPSVAVKILFKLTRRQLYDFDRPAEAIRLWESFNPAKKAWLWSAQNNFWEYMGLLFDAYTRTGASQTGEAFVQSLLDDPATPPEGLAYVGIPYGQWLVQKRRVQEAQDLFAWLIKAVPSHPLCAHAYYWKALAAYSIDDLETMEKYVGCIRRAQGNSVGLLSEWDLDAKAQLLLAGLNVDKVAPQVVKYTPERLHFLRATIVRELALLP